MVKNVAGHGFDAVQVATAAAARGMEASKVIIRAYAKILACHNLPIMDECEETRGSKNAVVKHKETPH